jgi:Na+/H+-dicarboxylate symporter
LNPKSLKNLYHRIGNLVETKLWAKVLTGMILGIIFGFLLSPEGPFNSWIGANNTKIDTLFNWLALPSKFFLKIIQMVIIPLIIASVITGIASTKDVEQMKSLGFRYSIFVVLSSSFASIVGLFWSSLIKPGAGLLLKGAPNSGDLIDSDSGIFVFRPESLANILPSNPLASIVEGQMLDVVMIAIIGGIAMISVEQKQSKSIINLLEVVQEVCITIISWAMRLAPLAVFGMMAQVAGTTGAKALQSMGLYVVCAFIGFISSLLIYILLVSVVAKLSPLTFFKKIMTPALLAFSTSSSAATMPLTIKVAEEELAVDPSVASFLIPLGTTVNMAGSAIWHTTAVVFLGQAYDINLSYVQIALVVATSIGSAIGSPGVPGVGIGVLSAVLLKVGIPIEGIGLIMGVDRLVDMGCTVVNVTGDLASAVIFGREKSGTP